MNDAVQTYTWQPIETCPVNTAGLILRRDGVIVIGFILANRRSAVTDLDFGNASARFYFPLSGDEGDESPTHWMPLPKPPAGKAGA